MSFKERFNRLVTGIERGSVEAYKLVCNKCLTNVLSFDLELDEGELNPETMDLPVVGPLTRCDIVFPQYGRFVNDRSNSRLPPSDSEAQLHHAIFGPVLMSMYNDSRVGQSPFSLDEVVQVIKGENNPYTVTSMNQGKLVYSLVSLAGVKDRNRPDPLPLSHQAPDPPYFDNLREDLRSALRRINAYRG